ncbi:hypothetical protein POTOM_037121 [Populus tomentosa]|uniref:CREG-like beta-barrel domain-containing protein n=1 Tax=Populus tomentosa TaxID=118781 RepID=A0A8X7YVY5_POPTO|nr:hypothetical protein POTOM_037121 [Populus tomentosa]
MESLSRTVFMTNSETYPILNNIPSSSFKLHNTKPTGSLKFAETPHSSSLRLQAFARDVSGDADDQGPFTNNGFGFFSDDILSLPQTITGCIKWLLRLSSDGLSCVMKDNIEQSESSEKDAENILKVETPLIVPHGSGTGGGTRAGLFRTPISGGVQSATSAHGLPRPALAVRNLMEQARFAHLCTVMSRMHHRREGYPFGSLVDFAPDPMGHPIFSFSPLAIHTRNLLVDPRCTLVVQIPGWSGLSNARVTIFGDVFPLPEHQQEWAHKQYIAKHQQGPTQQWGNFYYFRLQNISDIYFIGGFGTVAWVDVKEYEALQPDKIAVDGGEQNLKVILKTLGNFNREDVRICMEVVTDSVVVFLDSIYIYIYIYLSFGCYPIKGAKLLILISLIFCIMLRRQADACTLWASLYWDLHLLQELNAIFSKLLKELLSSDTEVDDAAFISIDSKGTDIRVRQGAQFNIQRLSFEDGHAVETLEEAKAALWKLIDKGQVHSLQK